MHQPVFVNNVQEKRTTESQGGRNFGSACALFVICFGVTTLHTCYMKIARVLSQSDVRSFFMFIINPLTLMSDEDRFSRYNHIITRLSTQVILVDPIHFFRTNLSFSEL